MSASGNQRHTLAVEQQLRNTVSDQQVQRIVEEAQREAEAEVKQVVKTLLKSALLERVQRVLALEEVPPEVSHRNDVPRKRTSPAEGEQPPAAETRGWYVYGVTWADTLIPLDHVRGLEPGNSIVHIREGTLAAITSPVNADEFTGPTLQERAQDLDWIAAQVRSHNEVLSAAGRSLVPFRFGTVFADEAAVRQLLAARQQELRETLASVDGKSEWAIKVFRQPQFAAQGLPPRPQPAANGAPTSGDGHQYLRQRQREVEAQRTRRQRTLQIAEAASRQLAGSADQTISLPLQKREHIGREEDMILHWGYLLNEAQEGPFRTMVEQLADQLRDDGLLIELSGPWPPYNFVSRPLTQGTAL